MSRSIPEWIGKTDDSPAPDRVKLRVLLRFDERCHWSGRPIRTGDEWDLDHVRALVNGGENRESNLAPILRSEHPAKTRQDVKMKAKAARLRKRQFGLHGAARPMPGSRRSKWKKPLHGPAVLREGEKT